MTILNVLRKRWYVFFLAGVLLFACFVLFVVGRTGLIALKYAPLRHGWGRALIDDMETYWNDMSTLEESAEKGDIHALRALLWVRVYADGACAEDFPDTNALVLRNGERGLALIRNDKRLWAHYGNWLTDATDAAARADALKAQAALLALMRNDTSAFPRANPKCLETMDLIPDGGGVFRWGGFTLDIRQRTYQASFDNGVTCWRYDGRFIVDDAGGWRAENICSDSATL